MYFANGLSAKIPTIIEPPIIKKIEIPIANELFLNIEEIVKAKVAIIITSMRPYPYLEIISLYADTVFVSPPNISLVVICGLVPPMPKNIAPKIHNKMKINNDVNTANRIIETYFDSSIFVRVIGRISNNLIVPHLNSCATIPEATMIVNKPTTDNRDRKSVV